MNCSTGWHYERDGEQHGPVELAALRMMRHSGAILATTLVWHSSMGDWLAYDEAFPGELPAVERTASFTVGSVFKEGWVRLGSIWAPLVLAALGYLIVRIAVQVPAMAGRFLQEIADKQNQPVLVLAGVAVSLVGFILIMAVIVPLNAGYYYHVLERLRGRGGWPDLTLGYRKKFGTLIGLKIAVNGALLFLIGLTALPLLAGVVYQAHAFGKGDLPVAWTVLAVPLGGLFLASGMVGSVWLNFRWFFAPVLALDEQTGIRASLRRSWQLTKREKATVIGVILLSEAVSVSGFLLLCLGRIATVPLAACTQMTCYLKLKGETLPGDPTI